MPTATAPLLEVQGDRGATVVIVTDNSTQTILGCLQSVENTLRPDDQVVLVDNRSNDQTDDNYEVLTEALSVTLRNKFGIQE